MLVSIVHSTDSTYLVAAKVYSSYDNSVDNEVGFAVPVASVAVNVAAAAVYN